jgi:hypothetical protein
MVVTIIPNPNGADGRPVNTGGEIQTYSTSDADPNAAGIVPADKSSPAIFYQDPEITLFNEWKWSVSSQVWVQTIAP